MYRGSQTCGDSSQRYVVYLSSGSVSFNATTAASPSTDANSAASHNAKKMVKVGRVSTAVSAISTATDTDPLAVATTQARVTDTTAAVTSGTAALPAATTAVCAVTTATTAAGEAATVITAAGLPTTVTTAAGAASGATRLPATTLSATATGPSTALGKRSRAIVLSTSDEEEPLPGRFDKNMVEYPQPVLSSLPKVRADSGHPCTTPKKTQLIYVAYFARRPYQPEDTAYYAGVIVATCPDKPGSVWVRPADCVRKDQCFADDHVDVYPLAELIQFPQIDHIQFKEGDRVLCRWPPVTGTKYSCSVFECSIEEVKKVDKSGRIDYVVCWNGRERASVTDTWVTCFRL